jgi:hypothetical protein
MAAMYGHFGTPTTFILQQLKNKIKTSAMPNVILKRNHTRNTTYDSHYDDALTRAIKQQHPDIKVKRVFEDYFIDEDRNRYTYTDNYNRNSFRDLKDGQIADLNVQFELSS